MNKELAIKLLRGSVLGTNEQLHEAVFMAIKALKAEPIRHGHWEYVDAPVFGNPYGSYECDYCGNSMPHKTNFCPNCGADMRGGVI